MKVGDLVSIVWTENSIAHPAIIGLVTKIKLGVHDDSVEPRYKRERAMLLIGGKRVWIDMGDLRVINESR